VLRPPQSISERAVADRDHRHSILLVDDDLDLVEAVSWMLEADGFEVRRAHSGQQALDLLTAGMRPCVVLLDIWMPEIDGWNVAYRLRATPAWSTIPIVMMSGSSEIVRAHHEGAEAMLAKPVGHEELTRTIQRHLRCANSAEGREGAQLPLPWSAERGAVSPSPKR
jgi:CheY-like chemotaxis protein